MARRRLSAVVLLLPSAPLLLLCLSPGLAQTARRNPTAGYIYPAGGKQGTTVHAVLGGQNLLGAQVAHVTGGGVSGAVVDYGRSLNQGQIRDAGKHIAYWMRLKMAEAVGRPAGPAGAGQKKEELPELPDHPWLRDLDRKSLRELDELRGALFDPKKQPNAQIAELVYLKLDIGSTAAPGMRELRIETPRGLSNPVRFVVGMLAEVAEREPNGEVAPDAAALPAVFNGQVMPGDTDRFRFTARRGQKLVITTAARALMPYLADAVPGWFQATLALRNADGEELAYADDYRFDPDPVLYYEVPSDGDYVIEIHDSIYRGREDFVYRISVSEQPFITAIFPLGGMAGEPLIAAASGWNLPRPTVQLDTKPGTEIIRQQQWRWPDRCSNTVSYAVDTLPECLEQEGQQPQPVVLPQIVNGRIGKPGDLDVFSFEGTTGQEVVAEVLARRLGSPLDSILRLTDKRGELIASNDDHEDRAAGLIAHQADSLLQVTLPKSDTYRVSVADAQGHGGEEYAYRLRLSAPRPDFALRVTPSSLKTMAGRSVLLTVHAVRSDGFDGPIDLTLGGLEQGLTLQGGHLPAGQSSVHVTLTAPPQPPQVPLSVRIEGRAEIGGTTVSHTAVPAEDMMQAFAYRHLAPVGELVMVVGPAPRWPLGIAMAEAAPVRLAAGGSAEFTLTAPPAILNTLRMELAAGPDGISIKSQTATPSGLAIVVQAEPGKLKPGPAGNLVLDALVETEYKRPNGTVSKSRNSVGILPAIPIQIVP